MAKEVTSKQLANALVTVAGFFSEMVESTKNPGEKYNRFDFMTSQMLGTMHWKAGKLIESTETKNIPAARSKAIRAGREHDGTEIKEHELNRALDYVEKLETQVAILREFQSVIAKIWDDVIETPFTTAPAQPNELTPKTPGFDRLRALTQKVGNGNAAASQDHRSNAEREQLN